MGVSGSGKTTVGRALADLLDRPFLDADDLHPEVERGERWPPACRSTTPTGRPGWKAVAARIEAAISDGTGAVVACSALRRRYRDVLRRPEVVFVLLDGPRELLLRGLRHRHGHFMPADLLDSQLATLERPDSDERTMTSRSRGRRSRSPLRPRAGCAEAARAQARGADDSSQETKAV